MSNITTITQTTTSSSSGGTLRLRPISPPATPTKKPKEPKFINCGYCTNNGIEQTKSHSAASCPHNPNSRRNKKKRNAQGLFLCIFINEIDVLTSFLLLFFQKQNLPQW